MRTGEETWEVQIITERNTKDKLLLKLYYFDSKLSSLAIRCNLSLRCELDLIRKLGSTHLVSSKQSLRKF